MKFRDGMWLVAEDKCVEYAEEVYDIRHSKDRPERLELLCPTKVIHSRGDTLNRATISIDIEAVIDGVISVEVTHFQGAVKKGPNFPLFPHGKPSSNGAIQKVETGTRISAGTLSANITGKPHTFDIRFQGAGLDQDLTSFLNRSIGFAYSPAPSSPMQLGDLRRFKHYILAQSTLSGGEKVYGLGERFGPLDKTGQSVSLWNSDGGTSSDQAYKNISFWLSSKGYGVFIDAPERIELEIGSERTSRVQMSVEGQRLKWYIIYGPSPKEVISRYTLITGRPNKLPAWSFGLWLSTSFTTEYDEGTVTTFLQGMRERNIPLEVFHFDCFWLREFQWCDFQFVSSHFPDPKGQLQRMKDVGLVSKVCVWINPYLGQASPLFAEAASKGYLLKRLNGDIFQWDIWQTGMGIVDFTNPAACDWYVSCLNNLFDVGVDAIKTDFGERIPSLDVQWHDRSLDPSKMHNFYAYLYNKAVYQALQTRYGDDQAVLFSRSACAGTQQFPLHWGGDCESTFEAMAESLRGALSLGVCGFSFWSVDIGGFEGLPDAALYKRWVAFGLLCSHSRLHGSNSYRVPWLIDDDDKSDQGASAVLRTFSQLKCRLMPYIYSEAMESIKHGWPVSTRAMFLEFPEDPTAWTCDLQFMLGSRLLVAPIFQHNGKATFYLPRGKWTSFWDHDKVIDGPQWITEKHAFDTLPMYVRAGTALVLGRVGEVRTVYDWTDCQNVDVHLYQPNASTKFALYDHQGNFHSMVTRDRLEKKE